MTSFPIQPLVFPPLLIPLRRVSGDWHRLAGSNRHTKHLTNKRFLHPKRAAFKRPELHFRHLPNILSGNRKPQDQHPISKTVSDQNQIQPEHQHASKTRRAARAQKQLQRQQRSPNNQHYQSRHMATRYRAPAPRRPTEGRFYCYPRKPPDHKARSSTAQATATSSVP